MEVAEEITSNGHHIYGTQALESAVRVKGHLLRECDPSSIDNNGQVVEAFARTVLFLSMPEEETFPLRGDDGKLNSLIILTVCVRQECTWQNNVPSATKVHSGADLSSCKKEQIYIHVYV